MAVNNSWRQPQNMNDWMRDIEKRLMHEERRPTPPFPSAVVGPGIRAYSNEVKDWNSEGPIVDGFFYSSAGAVINSPDDSKNWMGLVQANAIGQGLQRVWEYIDTSQAPSPDPALWTRAFITNADGTRSYSPWRQGGGGGSGTAGITVQDEGTTLLTTTQLDFYGAGVSAVAATGEVQITVDGTPHGTAGGDLTGNYPSPTIAAGAVKGGAGGNIADGTITAADLASGVLPLLTVQDENTTISTDVRQIDFQGPGVVASIGSGGEVLVTIAGGGSGVAGVGQVGEMSLWGTTTPPINWLICDGQSLLRADYPDLFAVIGTTYGAADGTHFNLPNLKGRVAVGAGLSSASGATTHALAQSSGEETHAQTVAEMATHSHSDAGHTHDTQLQQQAKFSGGGLAGVTAPSGLVLYTGTGYANIQNNGSGTPMSLMQPYLVINYIIRYQATAMAPGTVMVQDENAAVAAADIINFVGAGVTASDAGGGKINVTIPGPSEVVLSFPTPATSWAGVHNFNQSPVDVTLMNTAGEQFFGNITHPNANTAQATFGVAVAGYMLVQK